MITLAQKKDILDLIKAGYRQVDIAKKLKISMPVLRNVLNSRKRILIIADPHCGHAAGLTPPKWQVAYSHLYDQQVEMWDWFKQKVTTLKPDILFCLGDMVDGKGTRSGGTEQIVTCFKEQIKMADYCLKTIGAQVNICVFGTPYHVGNEEAYEGFLKDIKIGGHEFPKVHNLQFDLKHKISGTTVPYGNYTPQAKAKVWNRLWADVGGQPKSDVLIRGHVHKFDYCGDSHFLAMVCPALQGWGSKYGVEQCEKIVDTGLLWFDVYDGTDLSNLRWHWDIPKFKTQKVEVYKL